MTRDTSVLSLSHSEMRDRSTRLYFDAVDPGSATYSVLARATAAGIFRWPATQVLPMYDSRFSGLSPVKCMFRVGRIVLLGIAVAVAQWRFWICVAAATERIAETARWNAQSAR